MCWLEVYNFRNGIERRHCRFSHIRAEKKVKIVVFLIVYLDARAVRCKPIWHIPIAVLPSTRESLRGRHVVQLNKKYAPKATACDHIEVDMSKADSGGWQFCI